MKLQQPTLILVGSTGRMGRSIRDVAERAGVAVVDWRDLPTSAPGARVLVDFSSPDGLGQAMALARAHHLPLVSGTTGLRASDEHALQALAQGVAVLHATNMSLGVAVLRRVVREAARLLPLSYDPEVMEIHHRRKKDAPSGTALTLADDVREARGHAIQHDVVRVRDGLCGARTDEEIGVFGLRGGNVPGEHTVYFFGEHDRIELTHRAADRAIFAEGALAAARWIADAPPGRYTMEDIIR